MLKLWSQNQHFAEHQISYIMSDCPFGEPFYLLCGHCECELKTSIWPWFVWHLNKPKLHKAWACKPRYWLEGNPLSTFATTSVSSDLSMLLYKPFKLLSEKAASAATVVTTYTVSMPSVQSHPSSRLSPPRPSSSLRPSISDDRYPPLWSRYSTPRWLGGLLTTVQRACSAWTLVIWPTAVDLILTDDSCRCQWAQLLPVDSYGMADRCS